MNKPILTYYNIDPVVTAFSTTRHGGFSLGSYGEFNINPYCGDDSAAITKNLALLGDELNVDTKRIIMPHQTHGIEIRQISDEFLALSENVKQMILEGVDALITNVSNVCIGVSTADCIPILLYDSLHHAVAAVHAGWRGTLQCIIRKTVEMMKLTYDTKPIDLKAVIGPGISLDSFEVGDEVYEQFAAAGFDMNAISSRKEKWHIDLPKCNQLMLTSLGVNESNVFMSDICTFNNSSDYFSARKLGTNSGRIYTGVMLKQ